MEEVREIPPETFLANFNFRNLKIRFISPRHWIRIEVLTGVEISKDLHPQHGEDVDEDDEDEGEVGLATQGGDDDGEEDPHSPPCLSQFEDPHDPHQPHCPHDRQPIKALQAEVEKTESDDEKVKNVPAALEIFPPMSCQLQ